MQAIYHWANYSVTPTSAWLLPTKDYHQIFFSPCRFEKEKQHLVRSKEDQVKPLMNCFLIVETYCRTFHLQLTSFLGDSSIEHGLPPICSQTRSNRWQVRKHSPTVPNWTTPELKREKKQKKKGSWSLPNPSKFSWKNKRTHKNTVTGSFRKLEFHDFEVAQFQGRESSSCDKKLLQKTNSHVSPTKNRNTDR